MVPGGIAFEVGAIPAQSVLANLIGSRMEVRNNNPAIVPAFAADDLGAGEGIDSPKVSARLRSIPRLSFRLIRESEVRANDSANASTGGRCYRIS